MFRNYLKTALRNILKHKLFSLINIAGLAVGIACCLLIFLFVRDELAFDRYHENADRIFRLVDGFDVEGDEGRFIALTSAAAASALSREFPQVENAVRFFRRNRPLVVYGETASYEDQWVYADASLFDVFSFPLLRGDPATALAEPNTIVLSERLAAKYLGVEEPVGKVLKVNDQDFLVTGVMADWPRQTHFTTDMIGSFKTFEQVPGVRERYLENWVRHEFHTYLLLRDKASAAAVEAGLPAFVERHAAAPVREVLGGRMYSKLQPLTSIHLRSHLQHELAANGDIKYVVAFSIVAAFILLIACVNFMNLATARSAARAREVGLRKVVGAGRAALVRQFLGESFLIAAFALVLAVGIAILILPAFNALAGKALAPRDMLNLPTVISLLAILVVAGLASGAYPAILITAFPAAGILRRPGKTGASRSLLRRVLVVGQFGMSILLIISTAVVLDQLDFLRNRKLGFDKDHVVVATVRDNAIRTNIEAFKADLKRNPDVLAATLTIGVPGGIIAGDAMDVLTDEGKKRVTVRMIYTDHDYVEAMGLEIVEGRDFSRDRATDPQEAFIVNEAAVSGLGLTRALGTRIEWGDKRGEIVGVVRNFQYQSLREEITPLVIHIWPSNTFVVAVRIRPDSVRETLAYLERKWREYDPAHPFEYTFMDETFDAIYKGEERLGRVFSLSAGLAIFIASLGLFGLALFTVEARTQEIGIRKVLGASAGKIALLLSREFALLVLVANGVAWPAAYLLMSDWLRNFAYRVDIRPGVFVLSAGAAFAVALLTIGWQTLRAALADPVGSLRSE